MEYLQSFLFLCCIILHHLKLFEAYKSPTSSSTFFRIKHTMQSKQQGYIDNAETNYKNPITKTLGNFLKKKDNDTNIDFNMKKIKKISLNQLVSKLDKEFREKEPFVSGNVNPSLYSTNFQFEDPGEYI